MVLQWIRLWLMHTEVNDSHATRVYSFFLEVVLMAAAAAPTAAIVVVVVILWFTICNTHVSGSDSLVY